MCILCKLMDCSLTDDPAGRSYLLDSVKEIKKDHPWFYLVGPMSDEERVWYDLNSPLRKNK